MLLIVFTTIGLVFGESGEGEVSGGSWGGTREAFLGRWGGEYNLDGALPYEQLIFGRISTWAA